MPQRIIANSFVSGEISPELHGRHDLKAYFNGAASLENFIVRRTGGIRKRAGTEVLFTLDASVSPDDNTLDNKFKFFPYFYDTNTFGLLVLRLTADSSPVLQSKLIIKDADESDSTDWTAISIATGIFDSLALDELKFKQVGDTLFFTRSGNQSFTCKITMATRETEFTLLDNAITVPTPAQIEVDSQNFTQQPVTTQLFDFDRTYALYGVKDGVISKPSTAVSESKTPWLAGATVTITGTMDFSVHDYYILAKKKGMNFGKLSEIYPDEMIAATEAAFISGDLDFRSSDAGYNDNGTKLLNGDPALTSSSKATISIPRKCIALKTSGAYKTATPHYLVNFGATAADKTIYISCSPSAVKLDTMAASLCSLGDVTAQITPFYYNSDGTGTITFLTPFNWTSSKGVFTISGANIAALKSVTGSKYFGCIIESVSTKMSDCFFMEGFLLSRGGDNYCPSASAVIEVPPDTEVATDPNAALIICTPSVFAKYDGSIYTTLWQYHSPAQSYIASTTEWNQRGKNTAMPEAGSGIVVPIFHIYGGNLSHVYFTVSETAKIISSITIHLGTASVAWADETVISMPAAEYISASLYKVASAAPLEALELIGTFNIESGYVTSQKLQIDYPEEVEAGISYKLIFSKKTRIRGVTLNAINTELHFVDDNILPGAVTGQQDMLHVGDNNMDCDLFDVFEQRTVFAGSSELPFTLWFSVVGDLYNFYAYRPQADDDAFSATIPAKKASRILHLLASRELILFTEDGVYLVDSEGGNGFSFRTIRMRKICSATTSASVPPIQTDGKTVFIGYDKRTVYELKYDLMSDAIMPTDRSVLANHLTETAGIVGVVYQRFPDSVIWFLLDDGNLISMTYMPEHEVYGWAHHTIAATADRQTIVDIFDVGSMVTGAGIETTNDILLVCETADENGDRDTKTVIERLRPNICADVLTLGDDNNECTDHLGGDYESEVNATLITLRPESPEVNTQGIPKTVLDVCLRLRRSGAVSVKPNKPSITAMELDKAVEDATAGTLTLFSGDLKIMPRGYFNGDGQLVIKSSDARPCEILSAVYIMELP